MAERRANGGGDCLRVTNVRLAEAGDERSGRQRDKRVDGRFSRSRQRCGEHSFRRKLYRGRRTSAGLGANSRLAQNRSHYRDASIKVTLLISLSVVRPRRTRSSADWRRKLIPSFWASLRTSEVGFFSRINSRIGSVKSSSL